MVPIGVHLAEHLIEEVLQLGGHGAVELIRVSAEGGEDSTQDERRELGAEHELLSSVLFEVGELNLQFQGKRADSWPSPRASYFPFRRPISLSQSPVPVVNPAAFSYVVLVSLDSFVVLRE